MMNLEKSLPGLQLYQFIDTAVCDRLIDQLEHVRRNRLSENHNVTCFKSTGYQSGNLLDLDEPEIFDVGLSIRFGIAKSLGISQEDIDLVFLHFLDYASSGEMEEHDHKDKEDLTFLLYLNDCRDGDTVFYLNSANSHSRNRSRMSVKPKKGRMVVFNSMIPHVGSPTTEDKKIFAGGLSYVSMGSIL